MTIYGKFKSFFGLNEQNNQETPGVLARKRRLVEEEQQLSTTTSSPSKKRLRMEDDVDVFATDEASSPFVKLIMSPLRFFSEVMKKKKDPELIDLTLEENIQTRNKNWLNAEIQSGREANLVDTIQASPPTRLENNADEVRFVKVANPSSDSSGTLESMRFPGASGGFIVGSSVQKHVMFRGHMRPVVTSSSTAPLSLGAAKKFRVVTSLEKAKEREGILAANLSRNLKSKETVRRAVYSRLFDPPNLRTLNGVNHSSEMEQRLNYLKLLQRSTSGDCGYIPISSPSKKSVYNGLFSKKPRTCGSPEGPNSKSRTAVTGVSLPEGSTDISDSPAPPSSCIALLGTSTPLTAATTDSSNCSGGKTWISSAGQQGVEEVFADSPLSTPSNKKWEMKSPLIELPGSNTLEEELKLKDVYSPDFVKNLYARYNTSQREIERKIRNEEVRKDFHAKKNVELYEKDVLDRVLTHLKITSTELEDEEDKDEQTDTSLPEITEEMSAVIREALHVRDKDELVNAFRIPITGKDIGTLKGLNWLNDEIINFYMQMIVNRGGTDKFEPVYAFNTFFYPKYRDCGYNSVKRWTKKVDIFSNSMLIVPVHLGMHWCLAVVDIKKKSVNYYDSMGGNNRECVKALLRYLDEEHKEKKKANLDLSGWKTEIVKNIPQQMNGSDCGMFACKFAEYLSRRAKITFSQENMPYFRQRMIYEIVKKNLLMP